MRIITVKIETDSEESFDLIKDDIEQELSCCWNWFDKVEISEEGKSGMDDLIRKEDAIEALLGITPMRNTIPLASAIFNINKLPSAHQEIIRCKDCKWFGDFGCAIRIVDDSDKPTENDFCSFAERRTDE